MIKYFTLENFQNLCTKLIQPIIVILCFKKLEIKLDGELVQIKKELVETKIQLIACQEALNQKIVEQKTQEIVEASAETLFTTTNLIIMAGIVLAIIVVIWGFNSGSGSGGSGPSSGSIGSSSSSVGCGGAASEFNVKQSHEILLASQNGIKASQETLAESLEIVAEKIANTNLELEELVERQDLTLEAVKKVALFCKGLKGKIVAISTQIGL